MTAKTFGIFAILILFCSCTSNSNQTQNRIDYNSLEIIKKESSKLSDLGRITDIVKLETNEKSVLGTIYKIVVSPIDNTFLIGDFDSRKQILKFDSKGHFIQSYGMPGAGPGEYGSLSGFTQESNGNIIVLSRFKLIRYSPAGKVLDEKRINFSANGIESVGNRIYVSVLRYQSQKEGKKSILIFNSSFEKIAEIGEYDSRLIKYSYSSYNGLAKDGTNLYFPGVYDLNLSVVNTQNNQCSLLLLPNKNSRLNATWRKKRFIEDDRRKIKDQLHRFQNVFAFDNKILLFEFCKSDNIMNCWLLDLHKKQALIFPWKSLVGDLNLQVQKSLFVDYIGGVYDKGVIGVFSNFSRFNANKHSNPLLKDVTFNADDNPILVFFEFN